MMQFEPMASPRIPGIPGALVDGIWGARSGHWSFVISYIEGDGYHASWKNTEFSGRQASNKIDGAPFQKFTDAEEACKATLKQLKALSMSIRPRAPMGSLLKGNPLGSKQDAAPKAEPKAKTKPKKGKRK